MFKRIGKGLVKVISRGLGKGGGSIVTITSEDGKFDMVAAGAIVVRIITAMLVGLAIYYMNKLGLPGEEIMNTGLDALEAVN